MRDPKSYAKYQVYFFLYLAVVCELLIIIVERDEAEQGWLLEQARLKQTIASMIENLQSAVPVSVMRGATEMKVGETRTFTFAVSGLGARDEVTVNPTIAVRSRGVTIDSLIYPLTIRDSVLRNEHGERIYQFAWRAPRTGEYEFAARTGTNFTETRDEDSVKIGPLVIARDLFQEITGKDIDDIPSESIRNTMLVHVISTAEQLGVHASNLSTTAGYAVSQKIEVEGTTPEKADARPSVGRIVRRGRDLYWEHTFDEPGSYTVSVNATDNRGEGGKSHAAASFVVDVKGSALAKNPPEKVFANETFRFGIAVAGLNEMSQYRWTVLADGREVKRGSGTMVDYKPTAPGRILVKATYDGRPYPVGKSGVSDFPIRVEDTPWQIYDQSFAAGGEYPLRHKFEFRAARFGKRPGEYSKPVPASEIRIEAVDEQGNDLLDDFDAQVAGDHTVVTFWLKGRLQTEVVPATFTIRIGRESERYAIRLYRDDATLRP